MANNGPRLEQLWVKLNIGTDLKIAVGVVYRPPNQEVDFLSELGAMIRYLHFSNHHNIIVLGDFNVNLLAHSRESLFLSTLVNDLLLTQIIKDPTRVTHDSHSLIDLIIVNNDLPIEDSGVIDCSLSDHNFVYCTIKFSTVKKTYFKVIRDFTFFNVEYFNQDALQLDWNAIYAMEDINDKLNCFNSYLEYLFNIHAPLKTISINSNKKKQLWFTETLNRIRRLKRNAWSQFKRTRLPVHRQYFCDIRNYYNTALKMERQAFFRKFLQRYSNDSKDLWAHLRRWAPINSSGFAEIPPSMYNADNFNSYFIDSVSTLTPDLNTVNYYNENRFNEAANFAYRPVSSSEIRDLLSKQKPHCMGADQISGKMLQLSIQFCVEPLTHIINYSFEIGNFPDQWKICLSKPIPKKSSPTVYSDFRNISLLCVASKIAETALHGQLIDYLNDNRILPENQSGFRKQHSTMTALLAVTDDALKAQDKGKITLLTLLDMSKAFDCVDFHCLIAKLRFYGISESLIQWFSTYLFHRKQIVVLDQNNISLPQNIKSGVPQGSVLGPTLFSLFIADFQNLPLHSKVHVYADDFEMYTHMNLDEAPEKVESLNRDLKILSDWSKSISLVVNPEKCSFLYIGTPYRVHGIKSLNLQVKLGNTILQNVTHVKNLGVVFDENLSFSQHVGKLCQTAYFKLKQLYQYRNFLNESAKILLTEALVLSVLNYCDCVYGPNLSQRDKNRLQIIQNACVRFIRFVPRRDHITPYIRSINMLKLHERRFIHYIVLAVNIIKTKAPSYLVSKIEFREMAHNRDLIQRNNITYPIHNTTAFESSFSYLVPYLLNNLSSDIWLTSKGRMKQKIKPIIFSEGDLPLDISKF